ncbi:hypothetical protein D3C73_1356650 [compost metagenome]
MQCPEAADVAGDRAVEVILTRFIEAVPGLRQFPDAAGCRRRRFSALRRTFTVEQDEQDAALVGHDLAPAALQPDLLRRFLDSIVHNFLVP